MVDPDLQIRGEGVVIQTLRKDGEGQSQKQNLSALRASIWSKNKGGAGPGRATPLNPPLINSDFRGIYQTYFMILFLIDLYKMENTFVCLNIIKIEPSFLSLFSHYSIIKIFCSREQSTSHARARSHLHRIKKIKTMKVTNL